MNAPLISPNLIRPHAGRPHSVSEGTASISDAATHPAHRRLARVLSVAEITAKSYEEHMARRALGKALSSITLKDVLYAATNDAAAKIFWNACRGLAAASSAAEAEPFANILKTVIPARWRVGQKRKAVPALRSDLA